MKMTYNCFHSILSSGSTLFAQVHASDFESLSVAKPRGSLLTIQQVLRTAEGSDDKVPGPVVMAEVRCTGRVDILDVDGVAEECRPSAWTTMRGNGRRVKDWRVWDVSDRIEISETEWLAWDLCQECQYLQGRLKLLPKLALPMDKELRVWSPREYDRRITAKEWEQTPLEIKEAWQSRVEALSFAFLRRCHVSETCLAIAMTLTNTNGASSECRVYERCSPFHFVDLRI
jgi:hypothetical protein